MDCKFAKPKIGRNARHGLGTWVYSRERSCCSLQTVAMSYAAGSTPVAPSLPIQTPGMARPSAKRYGNGRGGRPWRRLGGGVKLRDQYTCQACGRVTEH